MKDLVKTLEGLPWIVRLIFTIIWGIHSNALRLFRSIAAGNVVGMLLAILLFICNGFVVFWILDIIFVILDKKIWWID